MSKLPSFQFYPGDWLKDPELRMASMSSKGIWIDLLCAMFEAKERGVLEATADQFCRLLSCPREEFDLFLSEARSLHFADVHEMSAECPQRIRIESRRMRRDENQRQIWAKQKSRQRERGADTEVSAECPQDVQPDVHEVSGRCPPLSSSSSSKKYKSADAPAFEKPAEPRSKPQRKHNEYENWLTSSLLPVYPIPGHCQQPSALRYLRKEKPSQETLDAYLTQVELWKPEWTASGYQPGLCTFLTEGKYREAPPRRPDRNGNGAERPGPRIRTWDEVVKES